MYTKSSITVIAGGDVWTGGANPRLLRKSDVVIVDGVVAAVEPDYRGPADETIDATGCIVIPGLINAHVHSGCTPHIRGVAEDQPIPEGGAYYHTLNALLAVGNARLTEQAYSSLIEWDVSAMLLGGATTIVEENFGGYEAWLDICGRLGFRGQIGLTYPGSLKSIGYIEDGKIVSEGGGDFGAALDRAMDLYRQRNGDWGGRLGVHLSPHGPDSVPEEILRETARLSEEQGIGVHLHLAQHINERETVAARSGGKSSVEYLHDMGFLSPRVMAMHVTFLEDGDLDRLAATGATIVHGAYRKSKEALTSPYWDAAQEGVNVALATDSFAHDMILDMRMAATLGKLRLGRSDTPSAEQVLWSATTGAARGLGRPDLGHLNPGARGDAVIVDLTSPFTAPVFDPVRALVYYATARDIRATLVDGRPVVVNGRVLGSDSAAVGSRAAEASATVWQAGREEGLLASIENSGSQHFCGPGCSHH